MARQQGEYETNAETKAKFQRAAADRTSLVSEFIYFLHENKKWWLLPILIVFGILGLLAVLSGSGAAPFIYTFF